MPETGEKADNLLPNPIIRCLRHSLTELISEYSKLPRPPLVVAPMEDRQRTHPRDAKEGDARQAPAPQIAHLAESYRTPPLRHIQASDGRNVPAGYCDVNLYLLSDSTHLLRITTTPGQHLIALPKPQDSLRPNFYNIYTAPILDPNGVTVDAIFVTVGENMHLDIGWYLQSAPNRPSASSTSSTVFQGNASPASAPPLGQESPVFQVLDARDERRVTL